MADTPITAYVLDWQDPIHGSFELKAITDFSETDNRSAETKFDVNGKSIGPKFSPGETAFSLTQTPTIENSEQPNWYRLRTTQTQGLLTVTEVGADGRFGARIAYPVVVSKIDRGGNNSADNNRTIELKCVDEPQIQ